MKSRPGWGEVLECLAGDTGVQGPCALATVLRTRGSTPLPCGAQAVLNAASLLAGTIGGGALEAEALRRGARIAAGGSAEIFDFPLQGSGGQDPKPICGGDVRVLVQPYTEADRRAYRQAWKSWRQRETGVLETRVLGGDRRQVESRWWSAPDIAGCPDQSVAQLLRETLAISKARSIVAPDTGPHELLALLHVPLCIRPQLLIAGAGHVGQALATQAALMDFAVVVIDDRPEWLDPSHFPRGTRLICGAIAASMEGFPIDSETYVALVTRGHQPDAGALRACIHSPAAYIGMIGSQRKVDLMRANFRVSGSATDEDFDRVHAPIGLEIGAQTAPEIAVSILAQVIAVRRKVWPDRAAAGSARDLMICAIILAAGRSRRMGSAKLLLPLRGRPVIAHVVAAIPRCSVGRIFVVLRAGDRAIPDALAGQDIIYVTNPDPEGDMLSSVRCGFRALPVECEAALVVLGDQPGITPALVETIVAARASSGCSLIVPRGPAGRGHPLLVGMEHREEVLTCCDGVGLRGLLASHPTGVWEVAAPETMALIDMDTPEDYAKLEAHFLSAGTVPRSSSESSED
ncbi:MAG TPA: XdhC family protein [Verrucomicrobiales bacterium]|nr:XdhC family protein [Verrucomicrobiales bacterium]